MNLGLHSAEPFLQRLRRLFMNWDMGTLLRSLAGGAAIAGAATVFAAGAEAQGSMTAIACTNLASRASLMITIDLQKRTVNSSPARISDTQITWYEEKEHANYKLDRKTGALESVIPSSTGGYFLHYQCKLNGT